MWHAPASRGRAPEVAEEIDAMQRALLQFHVKAIRIFTGNHTCISGNLLEEVAGIQAGRQVQTGRDEVRE